MQAEAQDENTGMGGWAVTSVREFDEEAEVSVIYATLHSILAVPHLKRRIAKEAERKETQRIKKAEARERKRKRQEMLLWEQASD